MALRDMEPRKILLIVGFVLAVFILGYLLYSLFFSSAKEAVIEPGQRDQQQTGQLTPSDEQLKLPDEDKNTGGGLPQSQPQQQNQIVSKTASGGLTYVSTLVDFSNNGATLAANGTDLLYYNGLDSRFYKISPDGKVNAIVDTRFFEADNIAFNQARNKAVIEYPDSANVTYNFGSGEQVTLPAHWQEFQFSQQGETLAFKNIGLNPENNWLALSAATGTQARFIQNLGNNSNRVDINWSPNNQVVATFIDAESDQVSGEQH